MSATPPICHIPPVTPKTQPEPLAIPSIPPADATIASLQRSVNTMRLVINYITGRQGPQGPAGKAGDPAKPKPARWIEDGRVETVVRIFQNNDKTSQNWVDVKQINQLRMKDGVTGESWTWDRDRK